jgi:hypothetical protein
MTRKGEQMKAIHAFLAVVVAASSAPLHADPVRTVSEYCNAIGRDIVNQVEAASKAREARLAVGADRTKAGDASIAESTAKRQLLDKEEEWSRLGCAGIVYRQSGAG